MNPIQDREENVLSLQENNAHQPNNAPEDRRKGGAATPRREPSATFSAFMNELSSKATAEEKIRSLLTFMKDSLSKHENPRFKDFWDARKECLPLFKDQLVQKHRSELWQEYVDISAEARRLKEVLDEQSVFAYEQIDLAIASIRAELDSYESLVEKAQPLDIPSSCSVMRHSKEKYQEFQKNLHLLNNFAARINSLRKEVIRTEMRVKNKNKLFEKLSQTGECVFPRRKDLIKQCSDLFSSDVKSFVDENFTEDKLQNSPLHQIREEIKSLQTVAKELTLSPQAFNSTRLKLSECWDKLKVVDKERKKEISFKKQQMKQNAQQVLDKIKEFEQFCHATPSFQDASKQCEEILSFMKTLDLSFAEQRMLKDELFKARAPVWEKNKLEQELQHKKEKELELEKRRKLDTFKQSLQDLLQKADGLELDELNTSKDQILSSQPSFAISKIDKMEIDKLLRQLTDRIDDKREKRIISLSDSDKEHLDQLSLLLQEKREARNEIKAQIESYRKILGGSGFDFEKAMMYRDLIEAEKERLDKVGRSIDEIEQKISEIEG